MTSLDDILPPDPAWKARRDYTPDALPPDKYGIITHTKDPAGYTQSGNRVVVPHIHGGARNFANNDRIVVFDPEDPSTGRGGTVKLFSEMYPSAAKTLKPIPPGQRGAAPAPAQRPAGAAVATPEQTTQFTILPIEEPKEAAMVPEGITPGPASVPQTAVGAALPERVSALLPLSGPGPVGPPAVSPGVSHVPPAPAPDQMSAMLALLQAQQLMSQLAAQQNATQVLQQQNAKPQQTQTELSSLDASTDLGLPYATPQAQKPQHRVVFHLGKAGMFTSRYHHIVLQENLLVLGFDTRNDDSAQFVPGKTEPGETIELSFDYQNETKHVHVAVPNLNFSWGSTDLYLFIIVPEDELEAYQATKET